MNNKIIQWNIKGARVNYSELLLLITKYCQEEIHFKTNNSINIKNYHSCNNIKQLNDKPCGGSSVIINNNIRYSEIILNTNMQAAAISATPAPQNNNSVFIIYYPAWTTQRIGVKQFDRTITKTLNYNEGFQ